MNPTAARTNASGTGPQERPGNAGENERRVRRNAHGCIVGDRLRSPHGVVAGDVRRSRSDLDPPRGAPGCRHVDGKPTGRTLVSRTSDRSGGGRCGAAPSGCAGATGAASPRRQRGGAVPRSIEGERLERDVPRQCERSGVPPIPRIPRNGFVVKIIIVSAPSRSRTAGDAREHYRRRECERNPFLEQFRNCIPEHDRRCRTQHGPGTAGGTGAVLGCGSG